MTVMNIFFDGTAVNHIRAERGLIYKLFMNTNNRNQSVYFPGPGSGRSGKYYTKKIDANGQATIEECEFNAGYYFDAVRGITLAKGWDENTNQAAEIVYMAHKIFKVTAVIVFGWSRGAVCSNILANRLFEKVPEVDVHIIAIDPVPGPLMWIHGLKEKAFVNKNVKKYISFLAEYDGTHIFHGLVTLPMTGNTTTKFTHYIVPANHFTIVGLKFNGYGDFFERFEDAKFFKYRINIIFEKDDITPSVGKLIKFMCKMEASVISALYSKGTSQYYLDEDYEVKIRKYSRDSSSFGSPKSNESTRNILCQSPLMPSVVNSMSKFVTTSVGSYRPFATYYEWRSTDIDTIVSRHKLHDKVKYIES